MEQQNKDMADGRDQPAQIEHKQKANTQKEMAEDNGARIVREAETARARIYDMPGNVNLEEVINDQLTAIRLQPGGRVCSQGEHRTPHLTQATVVDEDYMLVASHLDLSIKEKIWVHQYVDFSRLLKKGLGG